MSSANHHPHPRAAPVVLLLIVILSGVVSSPEKAKLCRDGIRSDSGEVCCAAACGQCGTKTRGCAKRTGGSTQCCERDIKKKEVRCLKANQTGCIFAGVAPNRRLPAQCRLPSLHLPSSLSSTEGRTPAVKNVVFVFALHKTGSTLIDRLLRTSMRMARKADCYINMICNPRFPCEGSIPGRDFMWGFHAETVARCDKSDLVIFSRILPDTMDDPVIQQYAAVAENVVVIHHIRHPWDVLISMFNSYTGTHPFPRNLPMEEIEKRTKEREALRAQGVNRYAQLYASHVINETTTALQQAMVAQERYGSWLSRYEDLVEWPRHWGGMLLHAMNLSDYCTAVVLQQRLNQHVEDEAKVIPDTSTHTAYLHPGEHLRMLRHKVLGELQWHMTEELKSKSGYWR
jgi:hypothetical protein